MKARRKTTKGYRAKKETALKVLGRRMIGRTKKMKRKMKNAIEINEIVIKCF